MIRVTRHTVIPAIMQVRHIAPAAAVAGNGLLNNLIAYWPGNEASGNLLDAHNNNLDLTDTNTVTNSTGKVYATARQYTRANEEYHTIADNALLDVADNDFTIAAWVYADSWADGAYNWIANKRQDDTTNYPYYQLYYTDSNERFRFNVRYDSTHTQGVSADSLGAPSITTWYLVIASHDSVNDTINIQVNNGTIDSAAYSSGCGGNTGPFDIGAAVWASGHYWDGRIGPTAFWKSAAGAGGVLTTAQRTALYNSGNGLAYSSFQYSGSWTGAVILAFDDGNDGVYNLAYPYMAARGIDGTCYIVSDYIGEAGKMTAGNLQTLDTAGWAIANHSEDHTDLTTLTKAQQQANLEACKTALNALGLTRASSNVAYPYGTYNADTLSAMTDASMRSGRTVVEDGFSEPVTANEYILPSRGFKTGDDIQTLMGNIVADLTGGDSVIIYMHDVVESGPGEYDLLYTEFTDFIDRIVAYGFPCKTIDQVSIT